MSNDLIKYVSSNETFCSRDWIPGKFDMIYTILKIHQLKVLSRKDQILLFDDLVEIKLQPWLLTLISSPVIESEGSCLCMEPQFANNFDKVS